MGIRLSGADDPEILPFFGMRHNDQPSIRRPTDGQEPVLSVRVIGVRNRTGEQVAKDSRSFLERDAVFTLILAVLSSVPLKFHRLPREGEF
jgi:hypothetical protein